MLRAVHFLSQPLVESLGWSLVHFLWQGLVLANVLLFLLFFLRRRSANARYLAACGVLLAMAACPVATFAWIWCHAEARPPIAGTDAEVQVVPFDAPLADGSATERTAAAGPALSAWEGPAGEEREASPEQAPPPAATSSFMPGLLHAVERTIPWLVLAWLAGVAACSLRLGLGWLRLRQLKSAGSDAAVHWQDVAAGLAQRLGVSRPVRFLESLLVEVPTVVGWLRPVVLLPARALTGLTPVQLESLLAHELAHIRRDDYLVNLLQTLIETLLFYHPGVWWVSGRVRQEREHCCDDLAVRVCRDRVGYVRALAALEELRATAPRLVVAAGDGSLLQRVRRLLGSAEARPGGLHVSLVTLLAVLLIATMFVAPFVIPAGTLADRPQHDQPTGTADEESGETTLLIANWGAVLDEPVVEQLCKLSAGEVKSQDGVRTWLANADKARQAVCAARDRKQFVTTSSRVEWLARDSVNPVGFCTVSGFHQASFTSCNVLCQRTTEMSVAGSEASLNLRLEFNGQAGGAGQQFELKKQLPASAKVAAGQAFLVAVDLGSLHDWRLRCVVAFEAVPVAASRRADYQLITSCDWWLPLTQTSVARLFRQAETWRQRAALRPQKMLTAWTRTLPHGAKVNLVAVGRPRLDPFRWWDAEGQPHAFDWRKLGGVPEQHELVAILRIWEAPGTVAGYDGNRNQRAGGHSRFGIGFYPDDWPETPGSQLVIVPVEELTAQGGPQLTVGFGAGPWPAAHRLPLREEVSRDGQGFFLDDRAPHPFDRQEKFAHAVLSWSFLPDREVRLLAVDKVGREHVSEWSPEVRTNRLPLPRRTESFDESFPSLPKPELDHFVVKTRPRHWVAFSGFAVQPAGETWAPVQITVRGTAADQITFVRTTLQSVPPAPRDFPRQYGDSLRAALAARRLLFLSVEQLDQIRGDFQAFVAEHQPPTLTAEQQQAILDSTARFVALSVGDYLSFPDALRNLKYRLQEAFARQPLTEEQQRGLTQQREWIRELIRQLPLESGVWLRLHAEPLTEFEELLDDPLWPLLKAPLSDEQFALFQRKLKERQELKIHFIISHTGAALAQALWPKGNWSSSGGNVWFAFDRAHRGVQMGLPALDGEGQVCVLDVPTVHLEYLKGRAPFQREQIEALLQGKPAAQGPALGDLGYFKKGDSLAGFRGARLVLLDTNDWYTADQIPDGELRRRIDARGADTIALAKHRPRGVGFVNPDAPFIAVRTGSGRLAVLAIHTFDPLGVTIHIRPRPAPQDKGGAKPAAPPQAGAASPASPRAPLPKSLPARLRALHGNGAVVKTDDAGDVVEVFLGERATDGLLAELKTLPRLRLLDVEVSN